MRSSNPPQTQATAQEPAEDSRNIWLWRILALGSAGLFYAIALSNEVYDVTSPKELAWHVIVRKAYSIGAFALVGFLISKARLAGVRGIGWSALFVAAFSALIEVGQDLAGSTEGLAFNVLDTVCGAIGGAIGGWLARRL